ncbi:MAG: YdeI/OmpD-associated family protein [Bdellovibrio sp.]|nr:YdeI/OmpD-associated family protein [Bdellovibrio sp.]
MSPKNSKVDAFIKNEKTWSNEVKLLREIALSCGLQEDFKWRFPCYTNNDQNIAIIQTFKNFCAFMFFNGASLKDSKGVLKAPGENSQTSRRLEFTSPAEVTKAKSVLKAFIKEAMKLDTPEKVVKKTTKPLAIPEELQKSLDKNKKLKAAFEKLTPGRQRLYVIHISSAKQPATRVARVEKCTPKILKGLGLND